MQVVLAVSERTLLPVVVPAREGRTVARRVAEAVEPLLLAIGIPAESATAERDAMQDAVISKTASRRVLGSLNDLAFQLQVGLHHFPDRTLLAQSLWLAQTPLKLIEYGSPERATLAAFVAREALRRADGRSIGRVHAGLALHAPSASRRYRWRFLLPDWRSQRVTRPPDCISCPHRLPRPDCHG
jgi:hypothetical protein